MSSASFFANCFTTPTKTPQQREAELQSHAERVALVSTLPLERRWPHYPLRNYQNFWFPEAVLPGVIALQNDHRNSFDPTDIFLVSYPKSGTTWLKALSFAIAHRDTYTLESADHPLRHRHPQECSPYLEGLFSFGPTPDLSILPSPRFLATHIPFPILPASAGRIVYLCRDPKDTLVSMCHFADEPTASFSDMFDAFREGRAPYGPVWDHAMGYWKESMRRPREVMFLRYEEMSEDPRGTVRWLARFMGMPFTAKEEREGTVEGIVGLCSFDTLKGMEVNRVGVMEGHIGWAMKRSSFFRKGMVGGWREHLTTEMARELDGITQQSLCRSGLLDNMLQTIQYID